MNTNRDTFEAAVKAFSQDTVPAGPSDELIRQTLERIEQINTNPFMERIINMKPFTKIAAAAVILIAVSAIFLFPTGGQSIALADVYARVQQAQAFMYKMSMTMNGTFMEGTPPQNMESEGSITVSTEYGMKMENNIHLIDQDKTMIQQMYFLPAEKKMIQVMPTEKAYMTMAFSEDLLQKMQEQNNDPRDMVKKIMETEYVDLGFSEIDGVKVQCFQTTDPAYSGGMTSDVNATIWIDVESGLPVRSEITMNMGEARMHIVVHEYVWDIAVQADDFVPVIPEDYKSMGNIELPKMDEEAAINGLRFYAELTDSYPEKIDMMNLMNSINKIKDSETEAALRFKEQLKAAETDEDKAKLAIQSMTPLQSLGMFHAVLIQEKKDPAYFGDVVTPEDTDAVLMRWKNDDGTYTVIFGDLKTGQMTYDDMVKLEPDPAEAAP